MWPPQLVLGNQERDGTGILDRLKAPILSQEWP